MDNTITKWHLKNFLDSLISNDFHTKNIMKLENLKKVHIYCKYNNLSGQYTGPVIEKFIRIKYNMVKNNTSLCIGDVCYNGIDYEIKSSNGGKNGNRFNLVQLRLNHNCAYLFSLYYLSYDNLNELGELFLFKLSKEELKDFILKYGKYAHGTISKLGKITRNSLNDYNNNKEYAIRIKYNDKCWNELLKFRIQDLS